MNQLIDRALINWKETREQTLIFLDSLTVEHLTAKMPRPRLDTFGKHLQELGVIQNAYTNAIITGVMDYNVMKFSIDHQLVMDAKKLKNHLVKSEEQFEKALSKASDPDKIINWNLPRNPTLLEHIYWLNQHETLHHGQFIAFCHVLKAPLPSSWIQRWNADQVDLNIKI